MPAQWLAVALIALAPLACIEYCKITHSVAHRHSAMMHHAGDAPLNDMQQLVHAVTDALPALTVLAANLIAIAHRAEIHPAHFQLVLVPPTPPPKHVASAPSIRRNRV
jgi:hypothetical protein